MRPKKEKKREKVSLNFGQKIRKNTENSEKYSQKFGKIEKNRKNRIKFGKILKIIWKNRNET